MSKLSRRNFLAGATAAGAAAVAGTAAVGGISVLEPATAAQAAATVPPAILPGDPRYGDLVRGFNQRWVGNPEYVTVASTAGDVLQAVQQAVRAGKRISARSGGHCYEDFVSDPAVQAVVDMSAMRAVYYDPGVNAFAVQPGATLLDVYEGLYKNWGVTIPGGSCPSVGAGGHIAGGGYGPLSRLYGLTVDHLYGVEVVVVEASGTARCVVATRDASDPNNDLWWAHTGGGGGNFGVVTRYLLRSPGATGTDPAALLPRPPAQMLLATLSWPWSAMTQAAFTTLLKNFGSWHEQNSAPGSAYASLFSQLKPAHQSSGAITLDVQIDATLPNSGQLLDNFISYLNQGVGVDPVVLERIQLPWLHSAQWLGFSGGDPTGRFKAKSAYMRTGFPDDQIAAIYKAMTRTDYNYPYAEMMITSYGGQINTVAPSATAVPARDSILKLHYIVFWAASGDDASNIAWIRQLYQDTYSSTGGVPVRNAVTGGCYVNYPDVDLSDPAWNTSGVPWSTLYYEGNYPRLQQVKARWDPGDVFRHAQSVALPGS